MADTCAQNSVLSSQTRPRTPLHSAYAVRSGPDSCSEGQSFLFFPALVLTLSYFDDSHQAIPVFDPAIDTFERCAFFNLQPIGGFSLFSKPAIPVRLRVQHNFVGGANHGRCWWYVIVKLWFSAEPPHRDAQSYTSGSAWFVGENWSAACLLP